MSCSLISSVAEYREAVGTLASQYSISTLASRWAEVFCIGPHRVKRVGRYSIESVLFSMFENPYVGHRWAGGMLRKGER